MDAWRNIPMARLLLVSGLLILAIGGLFSLPMNLRYDDLIVARAYYADPQGRETIASVQSREFKSFSGPLFHGNDARPLWLRLTLAPSADPDWVLLYQPNFTHHIATWLRQPDGRWREVVTGSQHAFSQREVKTLAPAVRVRPSADRVTVVYARVLSPTTPIYARALRYDDSAAFDSLVHMVAGAFIGIGLIMSMMSSMVYVSTRDSLWGLDALFNLSGLVMLALQLGLASRLVWPDSVNLVNQISMVAFCIYVAMAVILYRALFRLFGLPRWVFWPYYLSMFMLPWLLWLIASGHGDLAMLLNNGIVTFLSFWGLLVVFKARHPDPLISVVFRVAYAGAVLYTIGWSLSVILKLQTGNLSTLYPNLPITLFTMLMLMLVLVRNTQLKALNSLRLLQDKREAEQQLLFERQRHEDTHSFLGMLLHEIKNPLSTIRMTVSNLENELAESTDSVQRRLGRVHIAVDDIDDVLERGIEIDQLEQSGLVLELATVNVAALIDDFCAGHTHSERLQLKLPPVLLACVDSHLLGLMLRNLIDNALKYSPAASPVLVYLSAEDRYWLLEVRNLVGAAGFPDAGRVFAKYYRSSLAMRLSGMGLGLYWVRSVARRMGGDASYARDNDDVVFRLCLPI